MIRADSDEEPGAFRNAPGSFRVRTACHRMMTAWTSLRPERHILHVRIQSSVLRSELFYQRDLLCEEINRRSGLRLVHAVIIR